MTALYWLGRYGILPLAVGMLLVAAVIGTLLAVIVSLAWLVALWQTITGERVATYLIVAGFIWFVGWGAIETARERL